MVKSILIINGPNLNLLGTREDQLYGSISLEQINKELQGIASQNNINLQTIQSNSEDKITDSIHDAKCQKIEMIIINPAAYTHTSIAIRDAFLAVTIPFIEVHISNVYSREKFRHTSMLSDIASGIIVGFGPYGYQLALNAAIHHLGNNDNKMS